MKIKVGEPLKLSKLGNFVVYAGMISDSVFSFRHMRFGNDFFSIEQKEIVFRTYSKHKTYKVLEVNNRYIELQEMKSLS